MTVSFIVTLLLAAEPAFEVVEKVDGITIESRPVAGSSVVELRLTTTTTASIDRLCDEAFGKGTLDPEEPNLKARTVVESKPDERVTYDQVSAPVVSDRDYAVRATRQHLPDGSCVMRFEAANDKAPPLPKGFVRITKLKGEYRFEPGAGGQNKMTYLIHSDPGGSVPAFVVEGTRRKLGIKWVKLISSRARAPPRDAGT